MNDIRYRQVHLDFHTSECIPDIGKDFDENEFGDTLLKAHVDSITVFSRCHHGWLYYPSEKFPERIHPNLVCKDLLGKQIHACHSRGIKAPVYLPVQWDHLMAKQHPEWLVINSEGKTTGRGLYKPGFYDMLCLNTPYRGFVVEQALEVMDMYDVDGVFLDIINVKECSCQYCQKGMLEKGMDPSSLEDRKAYTLTVIKEFSDYVSSALRTKNPDVKIFYNHGHVRTTHRELVNDFTQLELESLPSGGWGYWDFPITVRYARTLGLPCIGMTGKFHTSWGDFHSLKTQPALEYECFRSLALNAGCSIGDQLHPYGKLASEAYDLIGKVYSSVEEKEPWCYEAKALVEIGVVSPDGFWGKDGYFSPEIEGSCRMLQESGLQFDVIDQQENLSKYKLIIIPDLVEMSNDFEEKLHQYLFDGGKLITSFKALEDTRGDWGFSFTGDAPYSPDFILPNGPIGKGLATADYVMYDKAFCIDSEKSEVLMRTEVPFFNREWNHFCSHQHTPSTFKDGYPAVVKNGNHIHFIHPVFGTYSRNNPLWYKTIVINAIDLLLGERIIKYSGPSTIMATINEQEKDKRYIVHMLSYIAERRGKEFDTIEDIIPLYNTKVSVKTPKVPKKAVLVPQNKELNSEFRDCRFTFTIPEISGHQMVEIDYKA